MLAPRFLAITPPRASPLQIDASAPERWLDAGLPAEQLAILLRDPLRPAAALLAEPGPHEALATRARALGITVLLSVGPDEQHTLQAPPPAVDGLHLRGRPQPTLGLRVHGRSAHLADLADDARVELPCAYWTFAPVFPTREAGKYPVGLNALRVAVERLRAPVLALGGVDADNAQACRDAGAYGIAGISCFFGVPQRVTHDARAFAGVWHGVLATT